MKRTFVCNLPMTPKGKARPKGRGFIDKRTGKPKAQLYMPKDYEAWVEEAKAHLEQKAERTGWSGGDGPWSLVIVLVHPRPKGRPSVVPKVAWVTEEEVARPGRPDPDNGAGSVMDAMSRAGIYTDDDRVVDLWVRNVYAARGADPECRILLRQHHYSGHM